MKNCLTTEDLKHVVCFDFGPPTPERNADGTVWRDPETGQSMNLMGAERPPKNASAKEIEELQKDYEAFLGASFTRSMMINYIDFALVKERKKHGSG